MILERIRSTVAVKRVLLHFLNGSDNNKIPYNSEKYILHYHKNYMNSEGSYRLLQWKVCHIF